MKPKLARRLLKATPWAMAESAIMATASLVTTLVIARILNPGDFGLASVAIATVALVQVFSLAGMPEALVRSPHVDTSLTDTAFWAIGGMGVAGWLVCLGLSVPIALLYDEPRLAALIAVHGAVCFLASLMAVPQSLLIRKLRTRTFAIRTLALKLTTTAVTIGLALSGAGAWAIVLGAVAGDLIGCIVLWSFQPRRPKLRFRLAEIIPMMRMGWLIGVEQAISTVNIRLFVLVFGRLHGLHDLGVFNFALRIVDELANLLRTVIQRLGLAFFSAIHRGNGDIATAFERGSHTVAVISSPVLFGFAAVAPDLIHLLFGAKWNEAVVITQLVAILWAVQFTRILAPAVLRALGSQSPLVINALLALPVTMGMLFLTANAPLLIAVSAYGARLLVTLPAGVAFLSRKSGLSAGAQIASVAAPLVLSFVMFGGVWALQSYVMADWNPIVRLIASVLAGVTIYAGLIALFDRKRVTQAIGVLRRSRKA